MQKQHLLLQAEQNMKKILMKLKGELFLIQTGKASSALINRVKVKIHETFISIRNLATINVVNINTIEIIPWNVSYLSQIEKAILTAGFLPIRGKEIIRINIPKLTEDSRKSLTKKINKIGESFKIIIRNERRAIIDNIKKLEKDKIITKDEKKKYEIDIQKITDNYINEISNNINIKSNEILTL